jgi:hypothetical protein
MSAELRFPPYDRSHCHHTRNDILYIVDNLVAIVDYRRRSRIISVGMLSLKVPQVRTHFLETFLCLEAQLLLGGSRISCEVWYISRPNFSFQ